VRRHQEASQQIEARSLACAVGADKANNLVRVDVQREASQRLQADKGFAQVSNAQDRISALRRSVHLNH
jgi:hypothetical protein